MNIIKSIKNITKRFLTQRPIKSIRTLFSPKRLCATLWVEGKKINFEEFLNIIGKDTKLIEQSDSFVKKFLEKKRMTIKNLPISGGLSGSSGGGGGNELLLYYITRLLKPNIVLESGVSAGASSSAILHALEDNKNGHLISSDLPLHLDDKDIGILVPNHLKNRWTIYKEGDEINLPIIVKKTDEIDLIYYDSLKTYEGKENFFKIIQKKFSPKIIIVDDIDRDFWFKDYSKKFSKTSYVVGDVGIIIVNYQ